MDWIIHALDDSSRKQLGCGNAFQITVELCGEWNPRAFKERFHQYCLRFPHLQGRLSRDFNLAPYWRLQKKAAVPGLALETHTASSFEAALKFLEAGINTPFRMGDLPLKVLEIRLGEKFLLSFIFDHRLFDARGAELFLQGFQDDYASKGKPGAEVLIPPAPAHLDRWSEQFQAGRKVNRARIAGEKNSGVRFLKAAKSGTPAANRFKVRTFDENQTRAIFERSGKYAGPFMMLPYSLAVSVRALHAFFLQKGETQGDLVIPVTRDMRGDLLPGSSRLLFNHLSFLFFRIQPADAADFDRLLKSLQTQLYDQVKDKMPEALSEASMLMRILPRSVLSRGLQAQGGTSPASFSFAFLGESPYSSSRFMEAEVENMIHMPRIPPMPGVGIFFSQYKKRLNVALSYLDSLMNEEEACAVMNAVCQL